jgi:ABC-type Fe3+-hydroxamate transport system substrate-binding protein
MMIFCSLALIAAAVLLVVLSKSSTETVYQPSPEDLRILSLVTAADDILCRLDCKNSIAAIDRHGRILPEMADVPVIAAGSSVSREMLLQYRINCAIVWYYQRDLAEFLRREGVFTIVIEPVSLANYSLLVSSLAGLCNKTQAAEKLLAEFEAFLRQYNRQGNSPVKVYLELYAPWKVPAKDSYISGILQLAGAVQAVEPSVAHSGTVSPETLAVSEVEAVFYVENFASAAELCSRPALRNSPAVKNSRVFAIPRKLICEGVAPEELLRFFEENLKKVKDK